jgi:hypothetical protein
MDMATRRPSDARRRGVVAGLAALAALAGLAPIAVAEAEEPPKIDWGRIHASVHHPLPVGSSITPRVLDDHPDKRRLIRGLADGLRQAGLSYRAAGGALSLNFDTEIERVPQTLQRGVRDTRGRVKFLIAMTVDEEQSGRRLWTGEVSYLGAPQDEAAIFDQILRLLVDEIGRSSKARGFTLE